MLSYLAGLCLFAQAHAGNSLSIGEARQILARTIAANSAAQSFDQWIDSPDHPSNAFKGFRDAQADSAIVCKALKELEAEDLSIFEHELDNAANAGLLSGCIKPLRLKLENYWQEAQDKLNAATTPIASSGASEAIPNREVPIDTSIGSILFDADLPEGEVALTFDDGPHPTRTKRVLDILKDAGIRATFFQVGRMVHAHPELTKAVFDEHHTVGSHSWNHPKLGRLPLLEAQKQVLDTNREIGSVLGVDVPFFRFPYGSWSTPIQQWLTRSKITTFFWNIDSLDWKTHNPVKLLKNVVKTLDQYHRKGIVLFHDIQAQTVVILPYFLNALRARHMRTVVFVPKINELP